MYAKLDPQFWPLGLEEMEYLAKRLKQLCWNYEVRVEKLMFSGLERESVPMMRFAILKWKTRRDINDSPGFDTLWVGENFAELTGMLRMLITVEEGVLEAARNRVNP